MFIARSEPGLNFYRLHNEGETMVFVSLMLVSN